MNQPNPLDLSSRSILVTGASSGIGRETAILLASLNARVILAGRDAGRLQATLAQLEGSGHRTEEFDLTQLADVGPWLKSICQQTGPLAGLVHSAGVIAILPVQAMAVPKIEEVLRTNLSTSLVLAKAFRQSGCFAKGSSLVFLSSVAGRVGSPALSLYSASKAGLLGLARSLAMEFAPAGIRVNCVAPGTVETEMTERIQKTIPPEAFQKIVDQYPLGLGTPRDVANAIAFLLADTGRWITGTELVVDGGYSAD